MKEGEATQRSAGEAEAVSTLPDGPGSCVQAHPPVQAALRRGGCQPGALGCLKILKT